MTAQIDDVFRYRDNIYSIAGISEGKLFDPAVLDLKPVSTSTACWRGYQATFALSGSHLVLDTLDVNLESGEGWYQDFIGPPINGVTPTGSGGGQDDDWFNNHARGLNFHLEYSGGLLLADGFLQELYVHMGFHPAWKYQSVIELVFENGILRKEFDRSEQAAEIRQRILDANRNERSAASGRPTETDIGRFIELSFDRSYRMSAW